MKMRFLLFMFHLFHGIGQASCLFCNGKSNGSTNSLVSTESLLHAGDFTSPFLGV